MNTFTKEQLAAMKTKELLAIAEAKKIPLLASNKKKKEAIISSIMSYERAQARGRAFANLN